MRGSFCFGWFLIGFGFLGIIRYILTELSTMALWVFISDIALGIFMICASLWITRHERRNRKRSE